MAALVQVLHNGEMMDIAGYFAKFVNKLKKIDKVTLVCEDYTATLTEEIKVVTLDKVVTITLPAFEKGELDEPVMFEVAKDDISRGKVKVIVDGKIKIGKSTTYEVTDPEKPLRVITSGGNYLIF